MRHASAPRIIIAVSVCWGQGALHNNEDISIHITPVQNISVFIVKVNAVRMQAIRGGAYDAVLS